MKSKLMQKPYMLKERQVERIYQLLAQMDENDKVHQLFCMITYGDDRELLSHMAQKGYGGLMMRPMELGQVVNVYEILKEKAKIPFLISANMEAGMNQVCTKGTHVGTQMAIGATENIRYSYELGNIIGKEARALGLNWAFAPVSDIDYNWRNPITNTRTYGSDPTMVALMASEYVKGLQQHGVAASVKHFPGDGVDERDQHLVTSVNSLGADEWMETYGRIYKESIAAGALTFMIGHIMQPAWSKKLNPSLKDEELLPATLSKELLQGLLRKELDFNGTIITDSSAMAGMCSYVSRSLAVPLSVAAGCDMILFTKNENEDIEYVKKGMKDGIITAERLDEAVLRILALKMSLGLFEEDERSKSFMKPSRQLAEAIVGSEEHLKIADEVADESITLVKEEKGVLPLTSQKYRKILVYVKDSGLSGENIGTPSQAGLLIEKLKEEGLDIDLYQFNRGFEGFLAPMSEIIEKYDLIIYLATLATKSNQTVVRIEWAQPMGLDCPIYVADVPTMFISLENPYHLADVPRIKTYINTYGSSEHVIKALVDKLTGRSPFKGKSPVDPFCGFWDARL